MDSTREVVEMVAKTHDWLLDDYREAFEDVCTQRDELIAAANAFLALYGDPASNWTDEQIYLHGLFSAAIANAKRIARSNRAMWVAMDETLPKSVRLAALDVWLPKGGA